MNVSQSRSKEASELFYLKKAQKEDYILLVNYYNFDATDPVEASIVIGKDSPKNFSRSYMLDPNKVLGQAKIKVDQFQNILGLVAKVDGKNRFYFANVNIGTGITSRNTTQSAQARDYFANMSKSMLDLGEILEMAKAKVVTKRPKKGDYIDLSPEALDKTTIIDILKTEG